MKVDKIRANCQDRMSDNKIFCDSRQESFFKPLAVVSLNVRICSAIRGVIQL